MFRIGCSLILFLFLLSCENTEESTYMNDVNNSWSKNKKQEFQFNISDAQNPKNIIFVVRNNEEYPYSNIRFIVDFEEDQKKITTDTLNYILAKPNGEWLGTGFGNTKEILFQYKLNYIFPKNGLYKINIRQAMRKDTLQGIEDIGIKIEAAKP